MRKGGKGSENRREGRGEKGRKGGGREGDSTEQ